MRRALAIVGALAMVAAALFVRSRVHDANQRSADEKAKATLYCVRELEQVCADLQADDRNLTVVTEDANRTLATLSSPDFNPTTTRIDGWLAPAPYPELVDQARSRAGLEPLFGEKTGVLARSPLVLVAWSDRQKALAGRCGGTITWKCLGEVAGTPWAGAGGKEQWGEVKVGVPAPDKSAAGLLAAGQATSSWFGTPDFASNDLTNPDFRAWLERLAKTSAGINLSKPTPLDQMLFQGSASVDVAAALEAQAAPAVAASRDKDRLAVLYPSPGAVAETVMAPVNGSEPAERLKKVLQSDKAARSFAEHGWRVNGQPLAPGLTGDVPLPDGGGLPKAGVLQALETAWQGASR